MDDGLHVYRIACVLHSACERVLRSAERLNWEMQMKKENKPRSKHKAFSQMQFRLAGDDWLIALWNENNKQACYFLAEPIIADAGPAKGKSLGVLVSALERRGESTCTLPGLPKKFKTPDDAAEWLERRMDDYPGDTFEPQKVAAS